MDNSYGFTCGQLHELYRKMVGDCSDGKPSVDAVHSMVSDYNSGLTNRNKHVVFYYVRSVYDRLRHLEAKGHYELYDKTYASLATFPAAKSSSSGSSGTNGFVRNSAPRANGANRRPLTIGAAGVQAAPATRLAKRTNGLAPRKILKPVPPSQRQTQARAPRPKAKEPPPIALGQHDKRGKLIMSSLDACDCLDVECPGCFFDCKSCGSPKCGAECRVNRKWNHSLRIEESVDGGDNRELWLDLEAGVNVESMSETDIFECLD